MRRPEPYKQRHHRGVAGQNPRLAFLAGALVGIGETFCGCHRQRLRQSLGHLGRADSRECADLALAFAFEETAERAQARQRAHQRAAGNVVGAAHRHEGADVGGFQRGKARQRHALAPMGAKEIQALPQVAAIGLQRLRRQPPLGAEMRQPARHLLRDRGIGAGELDWWGGRFAHALWT